MTSEQIQAFEATWQRQYERARGLDYDLERDLAGGAEELRDIERGQPEQRDEDYDRYAF